MKIFILIIGTRGDLEIFLTLGKKLRERGHQIIVGTSGFYAPRVSHAQLPWIQIGDGSYEQLRSILESLSLVPDKLKRTHIYYQKWLSPELAQASAQISRIGATADYFISNINIGLKKAEKIVPGAAVAYDPPDSIENLKKSSVQKYQGRMIDIVAMNQQLLDPQNLWGEDYKFTGFWFDEQLSSPNIPLQLSDFLAKGDPPIAITMGSMVMFNTDELVKTIIDALRLSGKRGIIVGGWSEISSHELPADLIYWVKEIPYSWLFPQVAGIIHHGGVGTIAEVLRAGKPSIILPQVFCQECFAQILMRENLAAGMFEVDSLKSEELATAITTAITNEKIQLSTRKWQKIILSDQGIKSAVDSIEAHWIQVKSSES